MVHSSILLCIILFAGVFLCLAPAQDFKRVDTAEDFLAAVSMASTLRHVVIGNHLDLTGISPAANTTTSAFPIRIVEETFAIKTIRGNCQDRPYFGPANPGPSECVLNIPEAFLELVCIECDGQTGGASGNRPQLILSHVVLLLSRTEPAASAPSVPALITVEEGDLMLYKVQLIGDGLGCRGVVVREGQRMMARDSQFSNFQADDSAAVLCESSCRAGFLTSTFDGSGSGASTAVGLGEDAAAWFDEVEWIPSSVSAPLNEEFALVAPTAKLWLRPFQDQDFNWGSEQARPLDQVSCGDRNAPPFIRSDSDSMPFISIWGEIGSFSRFAEEQQDRFGFGVVPTEARLSRIPDSLSCGEPSDDSSSGLGPIIGGALGGVLALVLVVGALLYIRRRKARGGDDRASAASVMPTDTTPPRPATNSSMKQNSVAKQNSGVQSVPSALLPRKGAMTADTFDMTATAAVPRRRPTMGTASSGMSAGQVMDNEALQEALDYIYERRILFLGRFEMYGEVHRRVGGQGIVQALRGRLDEQEYVVKFFLNRKAFEREEKLYLRPELRAMVPAVKDIKSNADGAICTEEGFIFPPFMIVEKGQPLDEWAAKMKPDFPTILTVLIHILERLHALHSIGYAHRDIKPANVIWRPKAFSWTLIDFGCTAEIGLPCELSFSLRYSPPENIKAAEERKRTTTSQTSTDMWALGVIAYELLTSRPAFAKTATSKEIQDQIMGRKPLPWEHSDLSMRNVREMRMLRRTVKACLSRDPEKRPKSEELLRNWNALFDGNPNTRTRTAGTGSQASTAGTTARLADNQLRIESGALDGSVMRTMSSSMHSTQT